MKLNRMEINIKCLFCLFFINLIVSCNSLKMSKNTAVKNKVTSEIDSIMVNSKFDCNKKYKIKSIKKTNDSLYVIKTKSKCLGQNSFYFDKNFNLIEVLIEYGDVF